MSFRRQNRRAWGAGMLPVVLAVLALLTQALTPAVVAASESAGARTVVLCTSEGEKIVTVPDGTSHKPFAGFKCHDCVMAAVTAVPAPPAGGLPIRYAAIVRHERALVDRTADPARPPPRPPSQGPPSLF